MEDTDILGMTHWFTATPINSLPGGVGEFVVRLIMSAFVIVLLWGVRVLLCRAVRRKTEILSPDQRRWTHMIKNLIWVVIALVMVMIWAPQLRTAALSLAAFVVAIVIATKEVILCFTGAFMRVSTAPYRMGDWITIDGMTGEVVDINPFAVKMQELETAQGTYSFTGKIVQIPNSRYFTAPIENISYLKHFRPHQFIVAVQDAYLDGHDLADRLRAIVASHTADIKDEAALVNRRVSRNSNIPLPDPAPSVSFTSNEFNNLRFTVRAYLPTRTAGQISSAIHEDFSALVTKLREESRERERHLDAAAKESAAKEPNTSTPQTPPRKKTGKSGGKS